MYKNKECAKSVNFAKKVFKDHNKILRKKI